MGMSYVDAAYKGLAAADTHKWDEAIELLSKAITASPNPTWLIARSRSLTGANRFKEALDDAELAWHEAVRRSKRELIIEAQHRRGIAYNRLGELANADCCCLFAIEMLMGGKSESHDDLPGHFKDDKGFWTLNEARGREQAAQWDAQLNPPDNVGEPVLHEASDKLKFFRRINSLRQQILHKMEKLPADDSARKCTVTQKPPVRKFAVLGEVNSSKVNEPAKKEASSSDRIVRPPVSSPPGSNKTIRLQEIQSSTEISVSVFSKGNDKSKMSVKFTPFGVIIDPAVYPDGQQGEYKLATWGEIVPENCSYTVTPSKIELKLKKASDAKWAAVEYQGSAEEGLKRNTASSDEKPAETKPSDAAPATTEEPKKSDSAGPSYPSSSKGATKNWDKIDIDSDEDESDVNGFFKKLYKDATPEQQRAMMKSFTESSGTSLSTDWNDVKDRTVDAVPPEGVEAKKWEK